MHGSKSSELSVCPYRLECESIKKISVQGIVTSLHDRENAVPIDDTNIFEREVEPMLQIAICDDEASERSRLREWLTGYCTAHNLCCNFTEYACGEALYADYDDQSARFDLVFLDIYMGGMNGVETAAKVRQYDPMASIIFLTTSPDHAIEGYTVNADGYLLKPATNDQLTALMERLSHVLRRREEASLLAGGQNHSRRLDFADICWLESRNQNVKLHLMDGTVFISYERLCELESRLNAPCFLKCNRGMIVNMEHVKDASEDFVMCDGARIPIKVRERKNIREQYFAYMMATRVTGKGRKHET